MGAQHTPGPWRYGYANNYDGFYIAPDVSLPTLAAVQVDGRANVFNFPGQTEANARLIAAAPELLEAAREGLLSVEAEIEEREFEKTADEIASDQFLPVFRERAASIRAAIAKATGAA